MSRIVSFFAVIALFLVSGCAHDFSGIWKGQLETPNGNMELTYNFKTVGDSLTGTVGSPMGEIPISNGKIEGKMFSFDVDVNGMTIIPITNSNIKLIENKLKCAVFIITLIKVQK